jgi:hypothetical protein
LVPVCHLMLRNTPLYLRFLLFLRSHLIFAPHRLPRLPLPHLSTRLHRLSKTVPSLQSLRCFADPRAACPSVPRIPARHLGQHINPLRGYTKPAQVRSRTTRSARHYPSSGPDRRANHLSSRLHRRSHEGFIYPPHCLSRPTIVAPRRYRLRR